MHIISAHDFNTHIVDVFDIYNHIQRRADDLRKYEVKSGIKPHQTIYAFLYIGKRKYFIPNLLRNKDFILEINNIIGNEIEIFYFLPDALTHLSKELSTINSEDIMSIFSTSNINDKYPSLVFFRYNYDEDLNSSIFSFKSETGDEFYKEFTALMEIMTNKNISDLKQDPTSDNLRQLVKASIREYKFSHLKRKGATQIYKLIGGLIRATATKEGIENLNNWLQ